jgi:hypothetical protein
MLLNLKNTFIRGFKGNWCYHPKQCQFFGLEDITSNNMLNIHIIGAVNLPPTNQSNASLNGTKSGFRCVVKFSGREIYRTEIATSTNPTWNATYSLQNTLLSSRSKENCRPFYYECIEIDILDYTRNQNYGDRIFEARVPLLNAGKVEAYKLLRVLNAKDSDDVSILDQSSDARVLIDLSSILRPENESQGQVMHEGEYKRLQLCQVLSLHLPQFQHLYMSFDDWTSGSMIGCNVLPGPRTGELVLDKHEAEVSILLYPCYKVAEHDLAYALDHLDTQCECLWRSSGVNLSRNVIPHGPAHDIYSE